MRKWAKESYSENAREIVRKCERRGIGLLVLVERCREGILYYSFHPSHLPRVRERVKEESERGDAVRDKERPGMTKGERENKRAPCSSLNSAFVRQKNAAWILDRKTFLPHSNNPIVHLGKTSGGNGDIHTHVHLKAKVFIFLLLTWFTDSDSNSFFLDTWYDCGEHEVRLGHNRQLVRWWTHAMRHLRQALAHELKLIKQSSSLSANK